MSTFLHLRVTDRTAPVAQSAHESGEEIELKTRQGELLRGRVRGIQYLVGLDQGWFVLFEVPDDSFLMRPIGAALH
jgi:hypothetical protein